MGKKASKKKVEETEVVDEIEEESNNDELFAADDDIAPTLDSVEADADDIFEERSGIARQFEEEQKEDITEERTYTVPLSRAYLRPPKKRAKRAIALLRAFFKRHMKPEDLVILPEVNQYIWERGIERPPRRIRIKATKSLEGTVTLYLA